MKLNFLLHFLTLEITTHSPRLYDWLAPSYESLDQRSLFPGQVSTYHLTFEEIGSPHELAIEPMVAGTLNEYGLGFGPCYYQEGRFHSTLDNEHYAHCIEYSMAQKELRANIGKGYLSSEENFIYTVFRPLLRNFLLPFHGLKTLHGAVLTWGPQAVFLSGAGGMGKSTLSLQMVESGFGLLSDDSPFFTFSESKSGSPSQVVALSSLDHPRITESTLSIFPTYQEKIYSSMDISGKYALDRNLFQPNQLTYGPVPITAILCLDRNPSNRLALVPLNKHQLLSALLNESMLLFRDPVFQSSELPFRATSRFVFELISTLVDHAQAFTLTYVDHHLKEIPDFLKDHLLTPPVVLSEKSL